MQIKTHYEDGNYFECNIPDVHDEVLPGIKWGSAGTPFTPAYWRLACIASSASSNTRRYHLGSSLEEEVVACLLGGYGISGELGIVAYTHLQKNNALARPESAEYFEKLLSEPLLLHGRYVRYRYPRQKARYIAAALAYLDSNDAPSSGGRELRDWLTEIPGIGKKTASWIARNWLDASDIAILDIHIHRAGIIAGIFRVASNVSKDYSAMEEAFVELADAIGIPANSLDNQIWNELRRSPNIVRKMLLERGVTSSSPCGLPSPNNRSACRNYSLFVDME